MDRAPPAAGQDDGPPRVGGLATMSEDVTGDDIRDLAEAIRLLADAISSIAPPVSQAASGGLANAQQAHGLATAVYAKYADR